MKYLKTQAILTGMSSLKDRSCSLRFSTQEMSTEDKVLFFDLQGAFGWLLFAPEDVKEIEVPTEPPTDSRKTPAQRLRGVLFRIHEQRGGTEATFEPFYVGQMEEIISHFKAKLDL